MLFCQQNTAVEGFSVYVLSTENGGNCEICLPSHRRTGFISIYGFYQARKTSNYSVLLTSLLVLCCVQNSTMLTFGKEEHHEWLLGDNWTQLIFVNDSKPYMNINCER